MNTSKNILLVGGGTGGHVIPIFEIYEKLKETNKEVNVKVIGTGTEVEKNRPRPFLEDLDNLPFPDIEMWQEWIDYPETRPVILLGRGCPFQCTYCCNHALSKIAPGNYVRFRSPDNILKEVKMIIARFPETQEIYFEVETIGVNMKIAIELCSKLEEFNREFDKPLSFGINLRVVPNMDHEDLFSALKKANFRFINIGLESGSERVRKEILKRNYSNQDVIKTVKLAKQHGLKVSLTNLVGIPGETLADFKETIKCNRECMPDHSQIYIFFPYPGTDLYKLCEKEGLLNHGLDTSWERRKPSFYLPEFPPRQIQHQYDWFYYNVFKGHRPMYILLVRAIGLKIYSNYKLRRLFQILKLSGLLSKLYRIPIIGCKIYDIFKF